MARKSGELGVVALEFGEVVHRSVEHVLKVAAPLGASAKAEGEAAPGQQFVPQRVSFSELLGLVNPFHLACIQVKARVSVGLGFQKLKEASLPPSGADGGSFLDELHITALDLWGCGNGYLEVVRDKSRKVAALSWVPAREVEISADRKLFRQTPSGAGQAVLFRRYGAEVDQKHKALPELIHFRLPHNWSSYYGGPDWLGALPWVLLSNAATADNQDFFENHCIPSAIMYLAGKRLSSDDDLTPEQVEAGTLSEEAQVKRHFETNHGQAGKRHRVLILSGENPEGTIKLEQLRQAAKDGDFLKLLTFGRDAILSGHGGTPPRMVGVVASGGLGGAGESAGQYQIFQDLTIEPAQRIIEATLNRTVFGELKVEALFNRLDPAKYAAGQQSGAVPPVATVTEEEVALDPLDKSRTQRALVVQLDRALDLLEAGILRREM